MRFLVLLLVIAGILVLFPQAWANLLELVESIKEWE